MAVDYSTKRYSFRVATIGNESIFELEELFNIDELEGWITRDEETPEDLLVYVYRPKYQKFQLIKKMNPSSEPYRYLNLLYPGPFEIQCVIDVVKGTPTYKDITLIATFWGEK